MHAWNHATSGDTKRREADVWVPYDTAPDGY